MTDSQDGLWRRLTWGLFCLQVLLVLGTFQDYGITYDEEWRLTYGEYVVDWYCDGFERVPGPDNDALDYWTLPNEACLSGALASLGSRFLPLDLYQASHLLNALFGLLAGVGAWRLARLLSGERAGFFAALALVLVPRWYGHSFHNPIDVPMAAFTVWAVGFLVRWSRTLPRPSWRDTLGLGTSLGCALGTRIGALILFSFVGIALGLWTVQAGRLGRSKLRGSWARLVVSCATLPILAWLVLLPWWPKAQVHLTHPYWALRAGLSFPQEIEVFYGGQSILNHEVPRSYLTNWLWISLPGFLLLGLVLGTIVGLRRAKLDLSVVVVLGSVLAPLSFTWLTEPTDYDGMRHFLFLVPSLCVLASIGTESFLVHMRAPSVRIVVMGGLLVGAGTTLFDMVRLHPYQTVYFNRVVAGGLERGGKLYETDYWGASFKEGTEWVNANVQLETPGRRICVGSSMWPLLVTYGLDESRFEYVGSVDHPRDGDQRPEIYLATPRWSRHEAFKGEVLHIIERSGVPLLYIKKVPPDESKH